MALELCVLASGSSGNASVLRTPAGCVLIDAGIGPRTMSRRLDGTGCTLGDLRGVVLTHLDSDHLAAGWLNAARKLNLRFFCHRDVRPHLLARLGPEATALVRTFDGRAFAPLPGLTVTPIALAHDVAGSHGFVFDGFGHRLGYASDLGRVPPALLDAFGELDLLCLEANYDPQLQRNSSRPQFLKRRIMGGTGHLSNQQAFEAVGAILNRSRRLPAHVVLLHRSRQCNCPALLRELFERDVRIRPRLTLCEQHSRTDWLRPRPLPPAPGEQMRLPFG